MVDRFLQAQLSCIDEVRRQLDYGLKTGHWMWYIFPQVHGLGSSKTAEVYSIKSKEEAVLYLNHDVLGSRLRDCTTRVLNHSQLQIRDIFGHLDSIKFCSSMTLFSHINSELDSSHDTSIFDDAIQEFFNGKEDPLTKGVLQRWNKENT